MNKNENQSLADISEDYRLSSYHFDLPEERIAQFPSRERGGSRLYVLRRNAWPESSDERTAEEESSADVLDVFSRLPDYLPDNCLFVANNSRVIPARLHGFRPGGGRFELLLLTPLPLVEAAAQANTNAKEQPATNFKQAAATVLLRPAKKFKTGETYNIGQAENNGSFQFTVLEKGGFGQTEVLLRWQGSLLQQICACGSLPLPPYIRREAGDSDLERYQTVFNDSAKAGSVAAPTAGLHFTEEMRQKLLLAGHEWAELSLFVGYGTFSPVRTLDIRQHQMHPEYVEIGAQTVQKILRAKQQGRPIIAVGTTSTRVLEGLAEQQAATAAELLRPYTGWLNCFIHPGKPIRVIDGLLTNFHLPESSLLMLVSALCGRKRLLAAYARAVEARMRFFSYGDAMLII